MVPTCRALLVAAIGLTMVGAASAAGGKPSGSHSTYSHSQHVSVVSGASHITLKTGVHHVRRHHVHNWHGWSKRHWYQRYNCWVYWSPVDCCWYRYAAATSVYVPCEGLTTEATPE